MLVAIVILGLLSTVIAVAPLLWLVAVDLREAEAPARAATIRRVAPAAPKRLLPERAAA